MLGYLIGSLNPAALIGKLKHTNLKTSGTGNLGATNTMVTLGVKWGVCVMLFDVFKSFGAMKIAAKIVPNVGWLPLSVGLSAVVGHCFPFYLKFQGGKGLASFAGLLLAYNPALFLFLLITCIALMLIVNHSFIVPFYAAAFFTGFVAIREQDWKMLLIAVLCAIVLVVRNFENFKKVLQKRDTAIRSYIKSELF